MKRQVTKAAALAPIDMYQYAMYGFLALALILMTPGVVYASSLGDVLCDVVHWVVFGNLGRGLATLAVCIIGAGATIGKVSWGMAITVAVGIGVVFGCYTIVADMGIGGQPCT